MTTARGDSLDRLGARIRHHRRQLGLTLVEVADQAGISQPFLSQIERGKAAPSMSTLEGLAHALGTTQAHLLDAVTAGGASDTGGTGRGPSHPERVGVQRATEGATEAEPLAEWERELYAEAAKSDAPAEATEQAETPAAEGTQPADVTEQVASAPEGVEQAAPAVEATEPATPAAEQA